MAMPALVLVPGLLCDEAAWAGQLPALHALTTVQIAEPGLRDSLGSMADAIVARAPARFAIAGHSMGGRVALEVLRRVPERIAGLALLDTGCIALSTDATGAAERRSRMESLATGRSAGMRAMATQWLQDMLHPSRLTDQSLVAAIVDMLCRRTTAHHTAQIAALLARPEACALLTSVRCPTLVLCGREDRWSPVVQHQEMARLVRDSRLAIVEQCGHMCTMEQPEIVAGELCQWLAVC